MTGNLAVLIHNAAPDEIPGNSAFQHYRTSAYKLLLTLADPTGHRLGRSALEKPLREEETMVRWIAEHTVATTRRFVERSAARQTAGL